MSTKPKMNTPYFVLEKGSMITGSQFVELVGVVHTVDEMDEFCPHGEWYCEGEDCIVREVQIQCKLHGDKMPDYFACPLCGQPLKFHNWLDSTAMSVSVPTGR